MTTVESIKKTFSAGADNYLKDLRDRAQQMIQEDMTKEGEKTVGYSPSDIPAVDRMVALKHQMRQHKYRQLVNEIKDVLADLDEEDTSLRDEVKGMVAGAREAWKLHMEGKAGLRKESKRIWFMINEMEHDYMDEGLSESQYRRCLGWIFGNLEVMPGVKLKQADDGRWKVDGTSVTQEHYKHLEECLQKEMGIWESPEEANPLGEEGFSVDTDGDDACPGHVEKVDDSAKVTGSTKNRNHFKGQETPADSGSSRKIGDGLNPDTLDELDADFEAIDANKRRMQIIKNKQSA